MNMHTVRRRGRQTDSQGDSYITPCTLFAVANGIISKLICIKQNVLSDIRNIVLKYIPLFSDIVINLQSSSIYFKRSIQMKQG